MSDQVEKAGRPYRNVGSVIDADVLAFKVLLWAGRMKHPTRGGVLEVVELRAKEYGVKDRKVIDRAGQVVLEKLQLVR